MAEKSTQAGKRGRPKGSRNKATAEREREIAESGITPLAYMLQVLRDEDETAERRDWAAEKAAPYCHPRLNSMDARLWADINAKTQHSHVIDGRSLDPGKRDLLRALLQEAAEDGPQFEEEAPPEGEGD